MTLLSAGITTGDEPILLDSFEAGTVGNTLLNASEWGRIGGFSSLVYDNTNVGDGSQNAMTNLGAYIGNQSNTDGSATDQTGTFASYPFADCTIRDLVYTDDTDAYFDVMFGIPAGETDANTNCYRVRGGTIDPPFLRRTVNGTSAQLAQFTSALSTNTFYDIAVDFIDDSVNNEVLLRLRVWEWTGTSWQEVEGQISAVDTGYNFPTEGGIGIASNDAETTGLWHDYLRYYESAGNTNQPEYTL